MLSWRSDIQQQSSLEEAFKQNVCGTRPIKAGDEVMTLLGFLSNDPGVKACSSGPRAFPDLVRQCAAHH